MSRTNDEWVALLSTKVPAILAAAQPAVQPLPDSPDATIAATIDHTILKPDATSSDITALCNEAIAHKFKSCCINTVHTALVASTLRGSGVLTCVTVGFPLGACDAATKAFETATAVSNGADEVDTVLPLGPFGSGDYAHVHAELCAVVAAAAGRPVKVILETAVLRKMRVGGGGEWGVRFDEGDSEGVAGDARLAAACVVAAEAGVAFVKTCTGFGGGGATARDVAVMRRAVDGYEWGAGERVRVKASGGVKSWAAARAVLQAGADRIGTSSGAVIMEGGEMISNQY